MAFTVNFYSINKEDNSTARPTGTPEVYQCIIKHGSGLISPTIELDIGLTTAPSWNYCYIPAFSRYYYVNEWYFDKAIWTATLSCDVLATYRTEIGSANLYALRTSVASLYDGRVPDTLYPTKSECTYNTINISSLWSFEATGYGLFILGVTNKTPDFGSIRYYAIPSNRMSVLTSYLLSDTLLEDYDFSNTDASWELQKSLIDPLQYIKSCVYIPMYRADLYNVMSNSGDTNVFNWTVKDSGGGAMQSPHVLPSTPIVTITRTVNLPKHPQTSNRGNYVNQSPYTILTLVVPPFGVVEIDTTVTCNATTLTLNISVDLPSGLGVLEVECNGIVLNRIEAQIGIPVQLSQVTRDYVGGAVATVNATAGTVGNLLSGNIGGAISSVATGIGNAVQSLTPRSQTTGTGGAYAQLYGAPKLQAQFFEVVDDDIIKNGRPCCKIVNCSNNTGYYLIQDGDVMIRGTREECQEVRRYLESGFFWE